MTQNEPVEVLRPETKPRLIKDIVGNSVGFVFSVIFFSIFASVIIGPLFGVIIGVTIAVIQFVSGIVLSRIELKNMKYELFEDKIRETKGKFSTKRRSVSYENATDIQYGQSFLESQFDVGHIDLSTAGSDGSQIRLEYIENAEEVYDQLEEKVN